MTIATLPSRPCAGEAPKLVIALVTDNHGHNVFELRGIDAKEVASLVEDADKRFAIYVVLDAKRGDQPPLAGRYSLLPGAVRFTPRFPLQPGMRYRAVYRQSPDEEPLTAEFSIPPRAAPPAPRVAAVYPSAATLPENQLKFYLHFSQPMSRGNAYEHLRLLDADGTVLDLPFLELGEELWNPAGDRLTLLLDPARVKQGLKPREESGPVLAAGKRYTLLVDRDWRDAAGQSLATEFRKTFRVVSADETCPAPETWRLVVPRARSQSPLVVHFGESLDHALLERMLWITDERGGPLNGEIKIGDGETSWSFRPDQPWQPGHYKLTADTLLEDLAGNNIARPFELDRGRAVEPPHARETASVEFEVAK